MNIPTTPQEVQFLQGLAQIFKPALDGGAESSEPAAEEKPAPAASTEEDVPEPDTDPDIPFSGPPQVGKVFPLPPLQPRPEIPEPEPTLVPPETPPKLAKVAGPHADLVQRVASAEDVDPALLASMMRAESGGRPGAKSPRGAQGLFQLTPVAIRDVGMDPDEVLGDPEKEAIAAARYIKKLRDEYGASTPEEIAAAYNAGPGVIGKPEDQWPEETREHARRVGTLYRYTAGELEELPEDMQRFFPGKGEKKEAPAEGWTPEKNVEFLKQHMDIPWVKRLFDPNAPIIENEDGSYSTHLMMWSNTDDGGGVVFPTIYEDEDGVLRKHSPEEAARHAKETGTALYFPDAKQAEAFAAGGYKRGTVIDEGTPAEEAAETPAEEATETPAEEPGETLVDENGEPITSPDGEPITAGEVEESPVRAAAKAQGIPEEDLDEQAIAAADEAIKAAQLTPMQAMGIAILAIQHPEIAAQMLQAAEAREAAAYQQKARLLGEVSRQRLSIAREEKIAERMQQRQEQMLFRQQVQELHRRRRELLDQMAKDGIPVETGDLPEIPANIETPEELDRANAALDAWYERYQQAKAEYTHRRHLANDVTKAVDESRKGGKGSDLLKTLHPDWEKNPELRRTVAQLERQEALFQQQMKAEQDRMRAQADAARNAVEKSAVETERLRQLMFTDRVRAATEARQAIGRVGETLRQLQEQKAMLEILKSRTWLPSRRATIENTLTEIDTAMARLQEQQAALSDIAEQALHEGDLRDTGTPPPTVDSLYDQLKGRLMMPDVAGWQIPGGEPGMTLRWFVDQALKTGNDEFVQKYGPDVAHKIWSEALDLAHGNPLVARELTERWIRDVTTGAPWYKRPLPSLSGEEATEEQMLKNVPNVLGAE